MPALAKEAAISPTRNGNPVIYIALVLPAILALVAISKMIQKTYSPAPVQPTAIEQQNQQTEPARLIPAWDQQFVG